MVIVVSMIIMLFTFRTVFSVHVINELTFYCEVFTENVTPPQSSKKPYIFTKKPHISAKEPYIFTKESCISAKEPYISQKSPV